VKYIYYAFRKCTGLKSIYCKAKFPPSLGDGGAFEYINSAAKIYVPMESVVTYKNAYSWKKYADKIVGYDFN
jgi:hypothetical protein